MSPLRKVIKHKIATKLVPNFREFVSIHRKLLRLLGAKIAEKQAYILDKTLCLCVFVAKKRLLGVDSQNNFINYRLENESCFVPNIFVKLYNA